MHVPSLVKIPWHLLKLSSEIKIWACLGQITVKIWQNSPISNPKPDLHNINVYTKFGVNPLMFTQVITPETKIWVCLGQITPSKFDKIWPLAIPYQISTLSMHIPSLLKIHWCLLKLSSGNQIRMDGRSYNWQMDVLTRGMLWGYSFDLSLKSAQLTIFWEMKAHGSYFRYVAHFTERCWKLETCHLPNVFHPIRKADIFQSSQLILYQSRVGGV